MEMLVHSAGIKMRLVPFAGGGPAITELPTFKELGFRFYIWAGLIVLRGTPEVAIKTFRDPAREGAQDLEFKGVMAKLETPINYLDALAFQDFWHRDAKRLARTVKRVGKVDAKNNLSCCPRPVR